MGSWPPHIAVHTVAALTALVLGIVQLLAPKGTINHRAIGWLWVSAMVVVAVTSLMISETGLPNVGGFGPIHLLTVLTVVTLPLLISRARRKDIAGHRHAATMLFFGGLVIAGLFTLLPGRRLGHLLWSSLG